MTSTRSQRRFETIAVLALGCAIGCVSGFVAVWVAPPGYQQIYNAPQTLYSNATYWALWAALGTVVLWLGRRLPLNQSPLALAIIAHVLASVAFAFVHLQLWVFSVWIYRALAGTAVRTWTQVLFTPAPILRWQLEWALTMYWALIAFAHAMAYRQDSRERALTAARLDAELSQARLQALQQQMRPHFLFNSLQSISVLMHHSVDAAELMMERLGDLLRASLRTGDGMATVARELEYVDCYLDIEQMNLGDRLQVERDIATDARRCQLPELLLQPLVENAVRHGIAASVRGGTVAISVRREFGRLYLSVIDDGVGLGSSEDGAGIALSNTRRRLDLLYPGNHTFEILPGPGGSGVAVRITLPAVEGLAGEQDRNGQSEMEDGKRQIVRR